MVVCDRTSVPITYSFSVSPSPFDVASTVAQKTAQTRGVPERHACAEPIQLVMCGFFGYFICSVVHMSPEWFEERLSSIHTVPATLRRSNVKTDHVHSEMSMDSVTITVCTKAPGLFEC